MGKFITLLILALAAWLTPGAVILDGTARGQALSALAGVGAVQMNLGRRCVALAFCEYRPGRVYWRAAVGEGCYV